VPKVAGVLLQQVEQDAFKGRGLRTLPALARPSDVRQLVGLHHQAATCALRLEGLHEVSQALIAGDVPTLVPAVAPRLRDRHADAHNIAAVAAARNKKLAGKYIDR